ncbi:MAG: hypothetical protein WBD31_19985 [Rubripirellula sp.]
MRFTNEPVEKSLDEYAASIQRALASIRSLPGVVTVFQIGGLSAPGISDIDMMVIFEDDVAVHDNPLQQLDARDDYFFVHNLFGASVSHFQDSQASSLFHNYKQLHGQEIEIASSAINASDRCTLEVQVAIEYLVRMLINLTVDQTYGIVNVRNLLLQTHAIKYDLNFLKIESGELFDLVQQVIHWRKDWFQRRPENAEIESWVRQLYQCLLTEIADLTQRRKFYLPSDGPFQMGRNITLLQGDTTSIQHRGIVLPKFLASFVPKYARLQNRTNRFKIQIPFTCQGIPPIVSQVNEQNCKIREYNQSNLPHFMAPSSSLALK